MFLLFFEIENPSSLLFFLSSGFYDLTHMANIKTVFNFQLNSYLQLPVRDFINNSKEHTFVYHIEQIQVNYAYLCKFVWNHWHFLLFYISFQSAKWNWSIFQSNSKHEENLLSYSFHSSLQSIEIPYCSQ